MNTRNSNDVDPVFVLILIGAVAIVFGIYQLGEALWLDFQTMLSVIGRSVLAFTVAGVCIWFGREADSLNFSETWPLLLGLLYIAWRPAFNVWASHGRPAFMAYQYEEVWWNAWYTRAIILTGCGGLWFYLRHRRTSYY